MERTEDSAPRIRCKAVLCELGIPSALAVGAVNQDSYLKGYLENKKDLVALYPFKMVNPNIFRDTERGNTILDELKQNLAEVKELYFTAGQLETFNNLDERFFSLQELCPVFFRLKIIYREALASLELREKTWDGVIVHR